MPKLFAEQIRSKDCAIFRALFGELKRNKRWTDPIMTLIEPRGVTRMGGAKEYAAKFATFYNRNGN